MPLRVTLLPGDGVGPEVTAAARRVVEAAGVDVEWDVHEVGTVAWERDGVALPEPVITSIRERGLALKGPVATPVGAPFRSVNVALREALGLEVGIRPNRRIGVDVVRMNTEDLYAGIEVEAGSEEAARLRALAPRGLPDDAAFALKPLSRSAALRVARAAFEHAEAAGHDRVTAVHKATVMPRTDGVFLEAVREVARDHASIACDDRLVDTACAELVTRPERFAVLVAPMLYGDVLSDLAAALGGGLGLAPGANLGDGVAVFEAVHGTAARLAGRDVANPTAAVLSAAMLLRHGGETEAAERIERAVDAVIADGTQVTYDLTSSRNEGAAAGTTAMTTAICSNLQL
jgi:isocitrate dehydrogenase (NAD+)